MIEKAGLGKSRLLFSNESRKDTGSKDPPFRPIFRGFSQVQNGSIFQPQSRQWKSPAKKNVTSDSQFSVLDLESNVLGVVEEDKCSYDKNSNAR